MEYGASDALKGLLVRKGLLNGAGTSNKAGMKKPGAAREGAHRQCPATQGEVSSGIRLCWNNPHMLKSAERRTSRADLRICE